MRVCAVVILHTSMRCSRIAYIYWLFLLSCREELHFETCFLDDFVAAHAKKMRQLHTVVVQLLVLSLRSLILLGGNHRRSAPNNQKSMKASAEIGSQLKKKRGGGKTSWSWTTLGHPSMCDKVCQLIFIFRLLRDRSLKCLGDWSPKSRKVIFLIVVLRCFSTTVRREHHSGSCLQSRGCIGWSMNCVVTTTTPNFCSHIDYSKLL